MILLTNIHQLLLTGEFSEPVQGDHMHNMPYLNDAYLLLENGIIKDYGAMADCPTGLNVTIIDATDRVVLPCWCDSHTHLVYARGREDEFVDRINGLSYTEIAQRGGGILNSARRLQELSEEQLFEDASIRLQDLIKLGTGAIEIKSGYGLSVDEEYKMLKVIQRLQEAYDIPIKATLLAAHALPEAYKDNKKGYVDLIVEEMIPRFATAGLAQYIDVFCETGYFTVTEMERILSAGAQYGLVPKVHVNQFNSIGGIAAAVTHNALSVDHLEVLTPQDIEALQHSTTIATALPGCSYFLGIPYTPVRQLMDASIPVAIATDFNPGSAPSGNMNFTVAQACINLKMTPEEAIIAATINGAFAMGVAQEVGSITKGKKANIIITKPIKSYNAIPYNFGHHSIDQVLINGNPKYNYNPNVTKFQP